VKTTTMSCDQALGILAGETDDRDVRLSARLHASSCHRCRDAYVATPGRASRIAVDRPPADAPAALRLGLALLAGAQLVVALPWLFGHSLLPDAHVTVAHLTRDGGLDVVISGLGLVTAWRPRYAHSTLVIALRAFVTQLVAEITDREAHAVTGSFQLFHLLVVAIVIVMFCVDVSVSHRATPKIRPTPLVLHSR
jgi:hypothetical protein